MDIINEATRKVLSENYADKILTSFNECTVKEYSECSSQND